MIKEKCEFTKDCTNFGSSCSICCHKFTTEFGSQKKYEEKKMVTCSWGLSTMTEEITYEEWGRRIFDEKRYDIYKFDYEEGITYFLDNDDNKYKFAKYNGKTQLIEIDTMAYDTR